MINFMAFLFPKFTICTSHVSTLSVTIRAMRLTNSLKLIRARTANRSAIIPKE
ncbi:hypothetical protein [Streptococcus henryi]|uniref:hypothetical protein n=1 Tax=Streptococcus henryi TaxID=439219 RepID=UPI00200A5E53|nr:hypothetical protein [Streptococcus henryi]